MGGLVFGGEGTTTIALVGGGGVLVMTIWGKGSLVGASPQSGGGWVSCAERRGAVPQPAITTNAHESMAANLNTRPLCESKGKLQASTSGTGKYPNTQVPKYPRSQVPLI